EDECSGLSDESPDDDSDVVGGCKVDNRAANNEMPHYVVVLSSEEFEDELEEDGWWTKERGDACLHANLRAGKGLTLFLAVNNLCGLLRWVR
ncbi:hypothetical protein Tco_0361812, partial [Tanacetum coccineum]